MKTCQRGIVVTPEWMAAADDWDQVDFQSCRGPVIEPDGALWMSLCFMNSPIPNSDSSRPNPERLTPPKGSCATSKWPADEYHPTFDLVRDGAGLVQVVVLNTELPSPVRHWRYGIAPIHCVDDKNRRHRPKDFLPIDRIVRTYIRTRLAPGRSQGDRLAFRRSLMAAPPLRAWSIWSSRPAKAFAEMTGPIYASPCCAQP